MKKITTDLIKKIHACVPPQGSPKLEHSETKSGFNGLTSSKGSPGFQVKSPLLRVQSRQDRNFNVSVTPSRQPNKLNSEHASGNQRAAATAIGGKLESENSSSMPDVSLSGGLMSEDINSQTLKTAVS